MVVSLLTKLDIENGGTGAPSVVTPGLRWLFKGFVGSSGGAPGAGQFKVNGGALTTYGVDSVIGSDDNPSIDLDSSPVGTYIFEYNIQECGFGTNLILTNSCPIPPPPTCNSGTSSPITVCNGSCTVNLFDHLMGAPENTGTWSHISGPATLTFTGAHLGTVNFSGKTAGTYVARYTVLTCTTDITITVVAPPNAGTSSVTDNRCDDPSLNSASGNFLDSSVINFETEVGGTAGPWTVVGNPPPFGIVDLNAKTYQPKYGDGGVIGVNGTYGSGKTYTFQKIVPGNPAIVPECTNACQSTATLNVAVYPAFHTGLNKFGIQVCNDGSSRNLRQILNGSTPGGIWEATVFIVGGNVVSTAQLLVNGVLTTINSISSPGVGGGSDNVTIGFPTGTPAGTYGFRYKLANQNTICSEIGQVAFDVQACTPACGSDNPSIQKNVSGNCVNATQGGTISTTPNTQSWEYRTTTNGSWSTYTSGTNICGQTYVEFKLTVSFTNGCPSITKSVSHTFVQTTCTNSPTVNGSINSCQFTLTTGGSITSPINSDIRQWRYQGQSAWNNYSGPVTIAGTATIEYQRLVSYSDGCTPSTVGSSVSGQCGSSCNVTVGINGNNNLLTANTSGCGSSGQTLEWHYSSNGTSFGGVIGTGFTFTPTSDGYYRVNLTCGSCSDNNTYHFTATPPPGDPCAGASISMSFASNTITATRIGCSGTISYDWRYSQSGTGWSAVMNNDNSPNHIPSDGPGYYRVFTFCNGQCLVTGDYQVMGTSCNNSPTVSASFNSSTCQWTLTPGGTVTCDIAEDTLWWRPAGSVDLHQYGGPFTYQGNIEVQRFINCFDTCPDITTPWSSPYTGGTCCNGNTVDVNASFSQGNCQFTLTTITNVVNTIATDTVRWRQQGGAWNNYTGPFSTSGTIEYQRIVTFQGGACGALDTGIKTISGSCCAGNNPTVSGSYNTTTCQYSISTGGTSTSSISTDIVEWRQSGSSGAYTQYTGPFNGPSNIEIRRRVTYTDGCTATVPATASGNCCNGNAPTVNCVFDPNACTITLTGGGSLSSPVQSDVIRWRVQGSSVWNTYSGPVNQSGIIEYQREVIFSNGCTTILTTMQTCGGSCCSNNAPDVTHSFNSSDCKYTLNRIGTSTSQINTDVVEYRNQGSGTWITYTVPFTAGPNIEYRRTVTYIGGCTQVQTPIKNASGSCCANNIVGVSVTFNTSDCKYTITLTGSSTTAINTDVTEWRQLGSSGSWTAYNVPFTGPADIEVRRTVTYTDGCVSVVPATGHGICCIGNNPTVTCSYNGATCQYTLTPGGSFVSPISTDVIQWRPAGSGGSFTSYTGPFAYTGQIEYQRTVTFTNGCASVTTTLQSCNGTCCQNNQPDATCAFNTGTCQWTLSNSGTTVSPIATDRIEWRTQGSSGAWTTYSGPFTNSAPIEYRRVVTFTGGCASITTTAKSCAGVCCNGNNPDVNASFNTGTCQFTITAIGTNTSPVATDVIEWRPIGTSTWTVYSGAFTYTGTIEYRRTVTYSNGCATVISIAHQLNGVCCTGNNPTVSCNFNNQTCQYTLTKGGSSTSTPTTDKVYWRPISGGSYTEYTGSFAHVGQIEYYRQVIYSDGCAVVTTTAQSCNGACCGSNTPGVSAIFNPADCKYTITPTGTNVSTVVTDVLQWRAAGGSSWTNYTVPFTGPANIEVQRLVTYSDSCVANPTTTASGTCCLGSNPEATGVFNNANCTFTLTPTGTNNSPVASDVIRWRNIGQGWNIYSSPGAYTGPIEYQRQVTYSNGCPPVNGVIHTLSGVCCSGNQPELTCSFNPTDCKYTLTPTGTSASAVATDIMRYRLQGSGGAWTTYSVPFTFTGAIECERVVTYSDGCATKTSTLHVCSGDCCNALTVSTLIASDHLVATVGGCPGSVTIQWYYGSTFIGTGTMITPSFGTGNYEARAICSNGCQKSSFINYTCTSAATLNTSNTTLTVSGLSGCSGPAYTWEYSTTGAGGWIGAIGANGTGTLTMQNGNGYYRVTILCNGICPVVLSYHRNCTCSLSGGTLVNDTGCNSMKLVGLTGCSGSLTYEWTVDSGAQILSGQGTTNIAIDLSGNRQANVSVTVTCSDCGDNCTRTITNKECVYYGIQADAAIVCTETGCRIGLEVGMARLNQNCDALSSNLNDYYLVYEGVTYYATSLIWSIVGTQHAVYIDRPYSGNCSGSGSAGFYYKGCLLVSFTNIINECIGSCNPCVPPLCSTINSYFSGGQGSLTRSFIANGNGTINIYFTPNAAPDRFIFSKNGNVYYDSGCVTFNSGGFGPTNQYPGCSGTTVYQRPTGATMLNAGVGGNPFGIVAWLISMPVSLGDSVTIQVNGGCTGCAFVDNQTNWGLQTSCNF